MHKTLRAKTFIAAALALILTFGGAAQTKRATPKKKTARKNAPAKVEVRETVVAPIETEKKNARPADTEPAPVPQPTPTPEAAAKSNARPAANAAYQPVYFYEFYKPEFVVSKILIEHDENGRGKIALQKKDFAAPETDPLQLSAAALERVKTLWQTLNFLDSTENYQAARDYAHLGAMKFSMRRGGKTRHVEFNWTDNPDAKTLADEYRKIGQQLVWIFDINVARENQPLDAPRLLDALDSLVRRNEISDPAQMLPLLKELSDDERIPLIARNRAAKLAEKIEKEEKKRAEK